MIGPCPGTPTPAEPAILPIRSGDRIPVPVWALDPIAADRIRRQAAERERIRAALVARVVTSRQVRP